MMYSTEVENKYLRIALLLTPERMERGEVIEWGYDPREDNGLMKWTVRNSFPRSANKEAQGV